MRSPRFSFMLARDVDGSITIGPTGDDSFNWFKRNFDQRVILNRNLRLYYGMSIEEYEELLAQQGGLCAICRKKQNGHLGGRNGKAIVDRLYVDHNHKTGITRGLLCSGCNALVAALENPLLEKVRNYLEKYDD